MKKVTLIILLFLFCNGQAQTVEKVAAGIWKITYGTPEKHLPTEFKQPPLKAGLEKLPDGDIPVAVKDIRFSLVPGGVLAEMNVDSSERFYGFGLQTNTFEQRGMRREIRTNSWPVGNIGFGHAPMPFYISSKGYGVLINTSRYTTFYMASKGKLREEDAKQSGEATGKKVALSTTELYASKAVTPSHEVSISINGTAGAELYVFAGPEMLQVVQRYNLFSGGGALPPLWGLGFKYRAKATFTDKQVAEVAQYFRNQHIPCDMIGLEPGWQTASYSCSFKWNPKNFPAPDAFIQGMNGNGFKLNLWEHAYTHPSSPLFDSIAPYSGNYTVWSGAVPDFVLPKARAIFGGYHEEQFVKKGIAAFKLDECDAANYEQAGREWSFPDIARFPSGVDGIQMRQIFGLLYQQAMLDAYRKNNIRTMFDVRASYLFASPYTAALYSDMYGHADFVRMIVNSGFAGVNWSPELRETSNNADLIRRLQTITLSAHMVANCWYLDVPPWLQYNTQKNTEHILLPDYKDLEQKAKKLIDLRMSLVPYLYAAFAKYHFEGTPPFRPLVMDYPQDKNVWKRDDEYMMGESLLCAPFIDSASTRQVYLPEGIWYDFNSGKKYEGGRAYTITMSLDEIPMFVKDNTVLPLAKPVEYITPSTVFQVTCTTYGTPVKPALLFEDNSYNFDFEKGAYNWIELSAKGSNVQVSRHGNFNHKLYDINPIPAQKNMK